MRALVLTDYMRFELQDMPEPELGPEDVLVRVAACGICGSDIHGMDGSTGRRRPPLVMGHEAAGTAAAVGNAVTRVRVGDRVTFDSTVYCAACPACRSGRVNLCEGRRVLGVSCGDYRQHGAFAEYLAVPERIIYRLPDAVPFEHAAMVEPVSIAVHAVGRAGVGPGAAVAVVGTGMIGLLIVQVLRAAGCAPIVAVDVDPDRLAMAQAFGAATVVNATAGDVGGAIHDLTGGGADAVFEAVGLSETVAAAVRGARKGGQVVLVGNVSPTVEWPLQAVVTGELTLYGSCASSGEYPQCLDMMASGAVDVAPLISAVVPMAEGPAWFDRLYRREPGLMKVILNP